MEDNQRKGPGVFYGIMGVCTLVVAIIGATFAYFSATASDNVKIQGEAANTGLSLEVTHLSTDATAGLIPMAESQLAQALVGDVNSTGGAKACIDKNDNSVCQVYSIKVTNEGTTSVAVAGSLDLTPINKEEDPDMESAFTNLKWKLITDQTTVGANAANGTGVSEIVDSVTIASGASQTYYIAVWIENLNTAQDHQDKGYFSGTVSFNAASGNGIAATFTA